MSDLSGKIHSVTTDLRDLQQELQSPDSQAELVEMNSAALKQLKDAVDYLRQLLWTYIQRNSRKQGTDVEEQVRSLRLEHVTEMLQDIQQEIKNRQLSPSPAASSFMNVVQEIADAAYERHSRTGSDG